MNESADQTAVVISGGAAYGAFAIGVMKALFAGRSPATDYCALQANIFTGTSVGAFNVAVMVSFPEESSLQTCLRLEDIWLTQVAEYPGRCGNGIFRLRGDPMEYLDASCLFSPGKIAADALNDAAVVGRYLLRRTANFLASTAPLRNRLIDFLNVGSLVDSSSYRDLLHQVIQEERVFGSTKPLRITATNWITGQAAYFGNSDFHDDRGTGAIMASSALPGLFPPVIVDGETYVDGGTVENTPLQPAIDLGATVLHVIYLDPSPKFIPLKGQPNTVDTLLRVYYLMLATKIEEDIETARWINAGIKALEQLASTGRLTATEARDYTRAAGQIQKNIDTYKILTIHRYFPTSTLGGDLGMLDFAVDRIASMVQEGERIALVHNCEESGCVVS